MEHKDRPSHVPDPTGYTRQTALTSLDYVAKQLANASDEAFDAGDDISAGHHAHEANSVAFAAAALRQTCAGCQHLTARREIHLIRAGLESRDYYVCRAWNGEPADGSGYCHRWEAK